MLTLENLILMQGDFRLSADWHVDRGDRVAVIGPSGEGKSTLLSAIAGFTPVQSGQIRWDGQDLAVLKPAERPVSILFQETTCFHTSRFRKMSAWGFGLI